MKSEPINIILLGDPTAGKGTHAAMLAKQYGMRHFSSGQELRKLKKQSKALAATIQNTNDKGKLGPTKLVQAIMRRIVATTPKKTGIVFDGNPRMLVEAKLLVRLFKQAGRTRVYVLYLSIPKKEMVRRTKLRKRAEGETRPEDTVEALKNRWEYYHTFVNPVVHFFKQRFPFKKISTLPPEAQVQKSISTTLEQWIAHAK